MTLILMAGCVVVGMVIKILVPWPWADDKVRALWAKYTTKTPP